MINWQGIMLHHSATPDTPGVETDRFRRYHMALPPHGKGWQDIGYHDIIEEVDGVVHALMGRPAYMQGAHCIGKNWTHLGVCFTGNFDIDEMQEEQLIVGARRIAGLCVMNDIEPSEISCHRDWWVTDCPGKFFPFEYLIEEVEKRL